MARDRMHLTAFWRDAVPAGSSRLAHAIPVTCGLPDDVAWIQSEQSVATIDGGALVVNNVTSAGQDDRLIDVLVSGPLTERLAGSSASSGTTRNTSGSPCGLATTSLLSRRCQFCPTRLEWRS